MYIRVCAFDFRSQVFISMPRKINTADFKWKSIEKLDLFFIIFLESNENWDSIITLPTPIEILAVEWNFYFTDPNLAFFNLPQLNLPQVLNIAWNFVKYGFYLNVSS